MVTATHSSLLKRPIRPQVRLGALALLLAAPALAQTVEPPAPFGPLPSERQLAWHDRIFYGFVHFGPNTFTGVEWGEGREDPKVFAPTDLDCRQWVAAMKSAGMTGVILTAKHHDGFCLFRSEHTEHDVESSSCEDDVLAKLSEACREQGMWLGVYLSPWDRREPKYGTGEAYNAHFRAQLAESLTNYGPVEEVWFDGACGEGPNGKRQEYDWPSFIGVVREHQPSACIFSDAGPDVRWCGNERAIGSETNWALLRRDEVYPGYPDYHELGPGHEDGTHWVPYECNTSIRPGWFWKAGLDDEVKSLEALLDTWYASVGRSGNFLLNCPPDDRGQLPDVDVARLAALGKVLRDTFDDDVLQDAAEAGQVSFLASNVRGMDAERYGPIGLLRRDEEHRRDTYWATDDDVTEAWVELRFKSELEFDRVWIEEAIQLGQRVTAWRVEAAVDDVWQRLAEGTTIGARRVLRTDRVSTKKLRVYVDGAKAAPLLSRLSLYLAPSRAEWPEGRLATGVAPPVNGSELADPLVFVREPDAGLSWRRFEGRLQSCDQLSEEALGDRAPNAKGLSRAVTLEGTAGEGAAAVVFDGFVNVPASGVWTFATTSDDGSRVHVAGLEVVENDGLHGDRRRSGRIGLAAGYHSLRVEWFDAGGGRSLELEWEGPGTSRAPVPPEVLGH